jgi:hypothetical protein
VPRAVAGHLIVVLQTRDICQDFLESSA